MTLILAEAKPYAKAIFDLALSQNRLTAWLRSLKILAAFVSAADKTHLLDNPKISLKQKIEFFSDFTDDSKELKNLIMLLVERKKITLLQDIAASYQRIFFAHNRILEIKIVSAEKLEAAQKIKLLETFKKRHQAKILLSCEIDNSLIGGAVIHIGDQVIDSSIKGELLRLKQNLFLKNSYAKTK